MDALLVYIIAVFILTTLSHLFFLLIARSVHDDLIKVRLWRYHVWLNGALWTAILCLIIFFDIISVKEPIVSALSFMGYIYVFLGVYLIGYSYKALGFRQVMGYRFFFPYQEVRVSTGLYKTFRNPMYDGFFLLLVGSGLIIGIRGNFILALISFILLNMILAPIENYHHNWSWNPLRLL
jgi:protein-S-isoprenylcysteine O-methyltransferase Ste14